MSKKVRSFIFYQHGNKCNVVEIYLWLNLRRWQIAKQMLLRQAVDKCCRKAYVITFVIMDMQNSSQTWCMLLNRKSRTLSLWVWVTRHPFYLLRPYLRIYFAFISTENEFEFLLVFNITNVIITNVEISTSHMMIFFVF